MKKLLMCVLILGTIRLTAQEQKEAQAIPELQEWYSWKGGSGIVSYLPDFDSVGGGKHAITQGRGYDSPTWYNRFSYDTTNHFTWTNGGAYYVVYGDFNGDGIRDYWTVNDFVYRGIKKGAPPSQIPDTNYFLGDYRGYKFIADYNNDGFDDMLQQWDNSPCTNCPLFRIVWGGKELKKLKQSTVGNFSDMKSGRLISVYKNENGQWRLIAFQSSNAEEAFYLYELGITNAGEISTVEIKELDVVRKFKTDINERVFIPNSCVVANTYKQYAALLVATKDNFESDVYNVVNDKFEYLFTEKQKFGTPFFLKWSIDADSVPDYVRAQNGVFYFFSGIPTPNKSASAIIPTKLSCETNSIVAINDVNNDGVNDFAVGGNAGCFSVVLGLKDISGIGDEAPLPTFSILPNTPNPVGTNRQTILPLSVKKTGYYSLQLFDVRGSNVKTLYEGVFDTGEIRLPVDLKGLSSGMYIVRMSNGKQTRERAIMIGE